MVDGGGLRWVESMSDQHSLCYNYAVPSVLISDGQTVKHHGDQP